MAVAVGDQRRNKEAQEFLVQEIAKGDEDGIPNLLRTAIEVLASQIVVHLLGNNIIYYFIERMVFFNPRLFGGSKEEERNRNRSNLFSTLYRLSWVS